VSAVARPEGSPVDPLRRASVRWACAAGVFAATFALYACTLAPTVTFVDSGELIVAARTLGVAHPPGFPLYLLLAHLATWVPFGGLAVRAHTFSALCGAAAAAVLTLVSDEVLLTLGRVRDRPARPRPTGMARSRAGGARTVLRAAPGVMAGLLLGCSRTLWSYATVAEVYTLNTLLIVLTLFFIVRWRRSLVADHTLRDGWLRAAVVSFALGLGVHHVTVMLTLPGLAWLVLATGGSAVLRPRRLLLLIACGAAGLLVYLYLPLAAARSPLLDWGDPRTLERVWWHVTGRQYQSYFSFSPHELAGEAARFARSAGREFGPWWLPAVALLAAVGAATLAQRDRSLGTALALVVVFDLTYTLTYGIAEDKDAYYLPTYVAVGVVAAIGLSRLTSGDAPGSSRTRSAWGAAAAAAFVPLIGLVHNLPYANRSRFTLAHDYVDDILSAIEPNGMLLTLDWQVWSPMLYTRTIEALRRDVVVLDVNLLRRSWYFEYLRHEYPALMAATANEVDAFLEDLRAWEQDPARYERDRSLNQRISSRFVAMILAFVRTQLRVGPVYVTQDLALNRDPQSRDVTQALTTQYALMPQGLVFQLLPDRTFRLPAPARWELRGLTDGRLRFEADDVVRVKVFPVYVSMLYNRGRYLALHGRHAEAVAAYEQALALDPSFAAAQQALAESRAAMALQR
jgi:tetratricopeptide (TPR) repeat protein